MKKDLSLLLIYFQVMPKEIVSQLDVLTVKLEKEVTGLTEAEDHM